MIEILLKEHRWDSTSRISVFCHIFCISVLGSFPFRPFRKYSCSHNPTTDTLTGGTEEEPVSSGQCQRALWVPWLTPYTPPLSHRQTRSPYLFNTGFSIIHYQTVPLRNLVMPEKHRAGCLWREIPSRGTSWFLNVCSPPVHKFTSFPWDLQCLSILVAALVIMPFAIQM